MARLRTCPTCRRPFEPAADSRWPAFCSERCQLIDLGAWIEERHAIPGEPAHPDGLPDADTAES
jgi:endogenous inhibitor of DNA gyrase (YacG/DUF329 family)